MRIDTDAHRVGLRADVGIMAQVAFEYLWSPAVDLRLGGREQLIFDLEGDVSPSLPVRVLVHLLAAPNSGAWEFVEITAPGTVAQPLENFDTLPPDFDLAQVQSVEVRLSGRVICSGGGVSEYPFAIGPTRFEGGRPTRPQRAAWSPVKALDRQVRFDASCCRSAPAAPSR